ncbi:hypothetical protein ACEPAH_4250 [Sanghuangporus vaninii]
MSAQSAIHVVLDHQNKHQQRSHPQTSSDQHMTDPNSDDHTADGPRPMGSSSSVIRSPRKSAPPSAPLPPLPKGAMPPYQKPGVSEKDPSSSAHKSSGQSGTALVMAVDMAQKHSVRKAFSSFVLIPPQPSLAEQKPMNEARRPTLETRGQVIHDELRVKGVPASSSHRRGVALDPSPPPPPPKTGLFKRLTTRLAGTRSSPFLRALAASSEECLNAQHLEAPEEQREHEKPSQAVTPVPARAKAPVPDDKPRPPFNSHQSLNGRLSLAAFAEKRAEKRDAKAREEQRATDARRAAALAKTGLLPASRRYSVAPTPYSANEQGCARIPPFDPFAKDRIQHDTGSDDGFIVEEDASPQEKSQGEGGLSAAEVVIREWRERNARANEAKGKPQSRGSEDEQILAQDECRDISKTSSVTDYSYSSLPSASRDPESAPPTSTPEVDLSKSQDGQLPATVNQQSTIQSIEKSVPTDTSPEDVICGLVISGLDQKDSVLPPPPPPKKLHSARKDTDKRRRDGVHEGNDPRNDISDKEAGEKVALGNWRFPATTSSTASDSSAPTPRGEKLIDDGHPFSPASSGSGLSASTAGAGLSKPSRPEGALLASSSARKKEALATQGEKCQEDTAAKACYPATLSPTQIRLPASPGFHTSPRSCHRASTAPSAPFQHSRSQNPVNRPTGPSQALTVSLPALSPTASTSTSTSGGSTLPRTPSTSSHGHSPVRLLLAPLESKEDALLLKRPVLLPSITEPEPEPEPGLWNKISGVEEFGQLARLADLDLERSDCGALPPLSFGPSRNKPFGNAAMPIAEDDRQKRATLFGRRRTTQNNLPMITILESHSLAGNGLGSGQNADVHAKQPRYASSFTSLRRTVASVTTGLAGAAGETVRDLSPLRTSTTWSSRPPASPRPNAPGTNSLSPTGSAVSTPNQRAPGVGLRPRPLNPTIHSRGSILMETHAIEDAESRRLAELAFLD